MALEIGPMPVMLSRLQQPYKLFDGPNMIHESSFHCWRNSQCLMNLAEIVVHVVQRDGMTVIVDLLAVSIGEASKAAHVHSHCLVPGDPQA